MSPRLNQHKCPNCLDENHLCKQHLSQLQNTWYKKIKKSGFDEAEDKEGRLQIWSTHFIHKYAPDQFKANEDYYRIAGQYFHNTKFKTEREKIVFEKHTEGKTVREIAEYLKKNGIKGTKSVVQDIIKRIVKDMLGDKWKK